MTAETRSADEPFPSQSHDPITFFLASPRDVDEVRDLDPDESYDAFRVGERAWVAQTYLRLKSAGWPVKLSARPPEGGLVVFHAKQKHELAAKVAGRNSLVFVGIRADNSAPLLADFEVLQSRRFEDRSTRFYIPFWRQPGIKRRDEARGAAIERVAYFGRAENLHPGFLDRSWRRELEQIGIEWVFDEIRFGKNGDAGYGHWEDYRHVDAIIAVRPDRDRLRYSKPASKLINAWYAGVPALVGPEYAYRELRRSEDDFIEVRDPAEALAALKALKSDPERYLRMVAGGEARAAEFSFEATTARWAELLFETLPARLARGGLSWSHHLPLPVRLPLRRGIRWIRGIPPR